MVAVHPWVTLMKMLVPLRRVAPSKIELSQTAS